MRLTIIAALLLAIAFLVNVYAQTLSAPSFSSSVGALANPSIARFPPTPTIPSFPSPPGPSYPSIPSFPSPPGPAFPSQPSYPLPDQTRYYTTRGNLCQVNYAIIPTHITLPEYCQFIGYRGANFNQDEVELCNVFKRVQSQFQALGPYYAVKTLKEAYRKHGANVRFFNVPDYIELDPFEGCVPIYELPECFRNGPSACPNCVTKLPRTLELVDVCEDTPRPGRRVRPVFNDRDSRDIREFCSSLNEIKKEWDRQGATVKIVAKLQNLWEAHDQKISRHLDEPVPYYYKSFSLSS